MNQPEINAAAAEEDSVSLTGIDQALIRLNRSRARLRLALTPEPQPAPEPAGSFFSPVRRARAWLRTQPWGAVLEPVVEAANQAVLDWWKRQPVVRSALLAQNTLSTELSPLVRRYPIPAVLLTAGLTALVAGSGVWRWRAVRRSGLMLASQLRRVLIGQLGSPAVQSLLLGAVISYLAARKAPAAPATGLGSSPGSEPGPDLRPGANQAAVGE